MKTLAAARARPTALRRTAAQSFGEEMHLHAMERPIARASMAIPLTSSKGVISRQLFAPRNREGVPPPTAFPGTPQVKMLSPPNWSVNGSGNAPGFIEAEAGQLAQVKRNLLAVAGTPLFCRLLKALVTPFLLHRS